MSARWQRNALEVLIAGVMLGWVPLHPWEPMAEGAPQPVQNSHALQPPFLPLPYQPQPPLRFAQLLTSRQR